MKSISIHAHRSNPYEDEEVGPTNLRPGASWERLRKRAQVRDHRGLSTILLPETGTEQHRGPSGAAAGTKWRTRARLFCSARNGGAFRAARGKKPRAGLRSGSGSGPIAAIKAAIAAARAGQ
jgi:hypothetical protein